MIKEDFGLVQVRRVFYKDDSEIEFGVTTTEWAKINPIDKGTIKVITDGIKILVDKEGLLKKLQNEVNL